MASPLAQAATRAAGTRGGPITRAARTATGKQGAPARTASGKKQGAPAGGAPAGSAPPAAKRTGAGAPARRTRATAPQRGKGSIRFAKSYAPLPGTSGGARKAIVAEYALCILLIGTTPIIMRKPGKDGHLYVPNDIVRLSAVSLLFFALALISNTPRAAKAAAAFGALVTLGTLYNSAGSIRMIGNIFAASNKAKGTTASAPAGTTQINTPVFVPTDPLSNPQASGTAGTAGTGVGPA